MPEMTKHRAGTFCWCELSTTNIDSAKRFYASLFDWSFRDDPLPGGSSYTMLFLGGNEVAGMMRLRAEDTAAGVPPHWMPYVATDDADATAARVREAGGTIVAAPFDVMEFGRMLVAQDPEGAYFSAWQPKLHIGAKVVQDPGALLWMELHTRDVAAAERFYGRVFGWSAAPFGSGSDYVVFSLGAEGLGGAMPIAAERGPIPPHWMTYFCVQSAVASAARAAAIGGTVYVPPTDIQGVGTFAVIADPQGATFAVLEPRM
jgi:predicted enzyme related to lactoylglutathione lyase